MTKALLLPGWGISTEEYASFRDRIPCLDIVDYGFFSERPTFDFEHIVDSLAPFMEAELVMGYSMGALIAMMHTGAFPNLKRLVLLSPFAKFINSPEKGGQPEAAVKIMQRQLKRRPEKVLTDFWQQVASPDQLTFAMPNSLNADQLIVGLQLLIDGDATQQLSQIRTDLRIMTGEQDQIVGSVQAELIAKATPRSSLVRLPNRGHALPFTETANCIDLLMEGIA